jgi:TfoX/Sxy family transcriptional regulator of competence genes
MREEDPLLPTAERPRPSLVLHVQRPQEPEAHRPTLRQAFALVNRDVVVFQRSSSASAPAPGGPYSERATRRTAMGYDEDLADRIRELVARERRLSEKKMFGGLAFLIGGNMAVAASGQGGLLVRVDPDRSDRLVASTNARAMEMRGRQMAGWLRVDAADVRTKRQLARWVDIGVAYARSLPAKR